MSKKSEDRIASEVRCKNCGWTGQTWEREYNEEFNLCKSCYEKLTMKEYSIIKNDKENEIKNEIRNIFVKENFEIELNLEQLKKIRKIINN